MTRIMSFALSALLALALACSSAASRPYIRRGLAANNTGAAEPSDVEVVWSSLMDGQMDMRPVLSRDNSSVYVATGTGLHCLCARDGHEVWSSPMSGRASGVVFCQRGKDRLYVTARDGGIYAMHAGTGQVLWTHFMGSCISRPAALSRDSLIIYAMDDAGTVHAIDSHTGIQLWTAATTPTASAITTTTAPLLAYQPSGRVVVVVQEGSTLHALDGQTGEEVWRRRVGPSEADGSLAPALADNDSIILAGYWVALGARTVVTAITTGNGSVAWELRVDGPVDLSGPLPVHPRSPRAYALTRRGVVQVIEWPESWPRVTTTLRATRLALSDGGFASGLTVDFDTNRLSYQVRSRGGAVELVGVDADGSSPRTVKAPQRGTTVMQADVVVKEGDGHNAYFSSCDGEEAWVVKAAAL